MSTISIKEKENVVRNGTVDPKKMQKKKRKGRGNSNPAGRYVFLANASCKRFKSKGFLAKGDPEEVDRSKDFERLMCGLQIVHW